MNEIMSEPVVVSDEVLDIGKILGRREALALVAGRCSAAEAACLRHVRETKQYRKLSPNWGQFCEEHLHMSKANADRIIRVLDKFGAAYFELSSITRISPEAYAQIAGSVSGEGLRWNGEVIALLPENAEKLTAAVKAVKQPAEKPYPARVAARIDAAEKRCAEVTEELADMVRMIPGAGDLQRIQLILKGSIQSLMEIERLLPR